MSSTIPSADRPQSTPGAVAIGILAPLAMIGLSVVLVQDALAATSLFNGSWLEQGLERVQGVTSEDWMMVVGGLLAVLGLFCLWLAVAPRHPTAFRISSERDVYITSQGLARLARDASESVPGVITAQTTANGTKVSVDAVTVRGKHDGNQAVKEAVSRRLSAVTPVPKLSVRARNGGS